MYSVIHSISIIKIQSITIDNRNFYESEYNFLAIQSRHDQKQTGYY